MNNLFRKILSFIASAAFVTAVTSTNLISMRGMYEPEEPAALKKYRK